MKIIKLHGNLALKYGKVHKLDIRTPSEAVSAMCARFPGFSADLIKHNWKLVTKRKENDNEGTGILRPQLQMPLRRSERELHFIPTPEPAGLGLVILGGILLAGVGVVVGLSIPPQADDPNNNEEDESSFLFNGPINQIEQGHPVPLVYGKMEIGSIVGSASLENGDISGSNNLPSTRGQPGSGFTGGLASNSPNWILSGGKSGGSQRVAQEDPNTLQNESTAYIFDILSEGDSEGPAYSDLQWVKFDETPLQNPDGSFNFHGVDVQVLLGTPDQSVLPGQNTVSTTNELNLPVTHAQGAVTRRITDSDNTRAKVTLEIPALWRQDTENGDLLKTSVAVKIELQSNGNGFTTIYSGVGRDRANFSNQKTVAPYFRDFNINLPAGGAPWDIRVSRLTADGTSASISNSTTWKFLTEIIDAPFTYPYTAGVGLTVSARQFGSKIPKRSYIWLGLKVNVPKNYDPANKTYATTGPGTTNGEWDGTFKTSWTDNPAWVFYDLCVNKRYGLGSVLADLPDKWMLYTIAKYCDASVDDGLGGREPRFTCNLVLNKRAQALTVLRSLASAFRAITFWSNSSLVASQDAPEDPIQLIGPANTVDAKINYSTRSQSDDYSAWVITWNNPSDNYRQNFEVVEDADKIREIGWKPNEVAAFGCTSRGQAVRFGRWLRDDQKYANEQFDAVLGADVIQHHPGQIVKISDPLFTSKRLTGRCLSGATTTIIPIDGDVISLPSFQSLSVTLPNGSVEKRNVREVNSVNFISAVVTEPFTLAPIAGAMWVAETSNVEARQFRVLNISEAGINEYNVSGLLHDPSKYARVERNLDIAPVNYLNVPSGRILPPEFINVLEFLRETGNATVPALRVSWSSANDPRVVDYNCHFQKNNDAWEPLSGPEPLNRELTNVTIGTYRFRVQSFNALGQKGPWKISADYNLLGTSRSVPNVIGLTFNRDNSALQTVLRWAKPIDNRPLRYHIFRHSSNIFGAAEFIGDTDQLEFIVTEADWYFVQTYYIRQASQSPPSIQILSTDLPNAQWNEVDGRPMTLAELDPTSTAALNAAITNLNNEVMALETSDDLTNAVNNLNMEISALETSAEAARGVIRTALDRLRESTSSEALVLNFDAEQTIWAFRIRASAPNAPIVPFLEGMSVNAQGEWVLDGSGRTLFLRNVLPFDQENPRIYKLTAEFRVDQLSTNGASGSQFQFAAFLLDDLYQDSGTGGNIVNTIFSYGANPDSDGWTRVTWTVSMGNRAVDGINSFFGDPHYNLNSTRYVRFAVYLNSVNGNGIMRARGVTLLDITESVANKAAIISEEMTRITAVTAEAMRISALTSRVGTAESDITNLEMTKADGTALTAEAMRISALTSRVGTAESDITNLEMTKADGTALTAEANRVSRLYAGFTPDTQNLYFNNFSTFWAFGHLTKAPEATPVPLASGISIENDAIEGNQVVMDGRERELISRLILPFDQSRTRIWRFTGEFKATRLAQTGEAGTKLMVLVTGLNSSYGRSGRNNTFVSISHDFTENADPETGWTKFEWTFTNSETRIAGVIDFLGNNGNFIKENLHYLRVSFKLNVDNGNGAMRARNFQITEISDFIENQASIISEEMARITAVTAEAMRISALTSRVGTAESDITNLEMTKADEDALTAEAMRISALTSRVGTAESDITNLEMTKADGTALTAEAMRISALTSRVGTAESDITNLEMTKADEDALTAEAMRISALTSRVGTAESDITNLEMTKADEDALTAEAMRISALTSRVGTAESDITNLEMTKADGTALTAEAMRISALTSRVGTAESDITNLEMTKADEDALTAEAMRISALTSRVGTAESDITNLEMTKADEDALTAEAMRISALTSRVGTAESDITNLEMTKADEDALTAEAERITRVEAGVASATKIISLVFDTDQTDWVLTTATNAGSLDLENGQKFFSNLPSDVSVVNDEIIFDGQDRPYFIRQTVDYTPGKIRYYKITCQVKYDRLSTNGHSFALFWACYAKENWLPNDAHNSYIQRIFDTEWTDIEFLFCTSFEPLAGFIHISHANISSETLKKIRFGGQAVYNDGNGKMRVRHFIIEEITDTIAPNYSGHVTTLANVTAELQERVEAHWAVQTGVGDFNGAFIEARTTLEDGTTDSVVSVGAHRFDIYNPEQDVWKKALEISNRNVTFFGNLNALGSMNFGLRNIPVALQSFVISGLSDGDLIDFGGDLVNIPSYEINVMNLIPLNSSQQYVLKLINLSSTGANLYAKIIEPRTPITYRSSGSTEGTGVEPDIVLQKSNRNDSTDGNYIFTFELFLFFQRVATDVHIVLVDVEFFVKPDSATNSWVSLGLKNLQLLSSREGFQRITQQSSRNYGGSIDQHSGYEFGISLINPPGTGDRLLSLEVEWTNLQSSSTPISATPSGQNCSVTIIPQNS